MDDLGRPRRAQGIDGSATLMVWDAFCEVHGNAATPACCAAWAHMVPVHVIEKSTRSSAAQCMEKS